MNVLVILASGKSSRFGGFPKAFCKIGGQFVVQRTVDLGKTYFDDVYLVINNEIYPSYVNAVKGCRTIGINTGQGDAHSFLRAARFIKNDCNAEIITLCWGDTFYFDDVIFRRASELSGSVLNSMIAGVSLSSIDAEPYAWYETDEDIIKSSHFRSKDGSIPYAVHDQSVFVFDLSAICSQLEQYMYELKINDEEDYINREVSREMRLLDSFTYFYNKRPAGMLPVKYSLVEPGKSFSFNTKEELEAITGKEQSF